MVDPNRLWRGTLNEIAPGVLVFADRDGECLFPG